MKYKIMTIAVASLLPLGFAATASVANPTAEHEVTFTVAESRSISVAVNGEGDVLEFGTVAQDSTSTLVDAVTVTVSSPDGPEDQVWVQLFNRAVDVDGVTAVDPPSGVTLRATAKTISSGGAGDARVNVAVQQGPGVLYDELDGLYLNASFDVNFTLVTTDTAATGDEQSFFIRYELR